MTTVADRLAQIAAAKQARETPAAATPPAQPEIPANLLVPTEQRLTEAHANAGQLTRTMPVKPDNCPQDAWDSMTPDVQALVALGPQGQAKPVNPPEAQQELVASAAGQVDVPAQAPQEEPKKRGRKKAEPAPTAPTVDTGAIVAAIAAAQAANVAQQQKIIEALEALTEAVLGGIELVAK